MTARILVVDDVPANVELLKAKLESKFFLVTSASDGPAALEAAHSLRPDIILLDVMMPEMDGFEVCRRLKADQATSHIPVIMVTALSEREYRIRGLQAGADDFLTKPTRDLPLVARLKSLARLKVMTDEWRARLSTIRELGIEVPGSEFELPDKPGQLAIFESDRLEADSMTSVLRDEGHTVTSLSDDGADVEAISADAAIVGLSSEPASGLRLVSRLRASEATRQTPILAAVPDGADEMIAEVLELGASDYLSKPVELVELCARMRTQIRRGRYQRLLSRHYKDGLKLALQDELTGLYNRRYLTHHLQRLLGEAQERGKPVSAAMIDIDHFKKINDANGHGFGDLVLRALAERIAEAMRPSDTLARLGGEEFVAIMPEASEREARDVAERLRLRIAELPFEFDDLEMPLSVTISCGVACAEPGTRDTDGLLRLADQALYRAKKNGRNQVAAASELDL